MLFPLYLWNLVTLQFIVTEIYTSNPEANHPLSESDRLSEPYP